MLPPGCSSRHMPFHVSQSGLSIFPTHPSPAGVPGSANRMCPVMEGGTSTSLSILLCSLHQHFSLGWSFSSVPLYPFNHRKFSFLVLLSVPSPVVILDDFTTHMDGGCISCSNHVQLFETPWTVAHQAPLSMEFSRQKYWSG